jgi:hypothetical protein
VCRIEAGVDVDDPVDPGQADYACHGIGGGQAERDRKRGRPLGGPYEGDDAGGVTKSCLCHVQDQGAWLHGHERVQFFADLPLVRYIDFGWQRDGGE